MSRIINLLVLLGMIVPGIAYGKRGAPPKIAPVIYEGIRYEAPNDDGRRAYVQARDSTTNKLLWEVTVFQNHINPLMEEDVQHVYIKEMKIREGKLMLIAENSHAFSLDLKTHEIRKLK